MKYKEIELVCQREVRITVQYSIRKIMLPGTHVCSIQFLMILPFLSKEPEHIV